MNLPFRRGACLAARIPIARLLLGCLGVGWLLIVPSCNTVEFYEKGALQRPAMVFSSQPGLSHWEQKVFYSIEGAAGGIGASAGGGCGCY